MTEGQSRRFLMPMWDGGGNIPPELGVARRLVARGHQVHVLADPTLEVGAEAVGCTFTPWTRAPHRTSLDPSEDLLKDWETKNPLVMLGRARDRFIAGPAAEYAADTGEAIDSFRPDAVVPDAFLFGSIIAAQGASLPVALLVPNIWIMPSRGTPPMGPGFAPAKTVLGRSRDAAMLALVNRLFRAGLAPVNAARSAHGLAPLSSFYDQALGVERILVLTSPTFDYAAPTVPANTRYVGPILDDPGWTQPWTAPWAATDQRPLVLVGFSSTYQNQGPVLRRVVEALSALPVRAVVTVGQMLDAGEVASTDNVVVVGSAPHSRILAEASLAVSHCGHGTTMKTLAAGVPMVCIPMGRDQNDTAARVVYHGAGVRLSPSASAAKIRNTVQRVLGDERLRANASRLASAIADDSAGADVVTELETLAR
ncbi:MAG: glycosyltransferase [Acidimicrobiales bacterium]|nr:glycosyltransferase [Acidimicrobiales bacterium]